MEIIKKTTVQATWAELKAAAETGAIGDLIHSGDLIPFTLKSGENLAVRATHDGNGKLFFVLESCMKEFRYMNKVITNQGGWNASDMREYLNTAVFNLLPDDLQAVIAPTTIVQFENGKRIESSDNLFLLSVTQVFGKGDWTEIEPEDSKLDIFVCDNDRVRKRGRPSVWWWLRSPCSLPFGKLPCENFHVVSPSGDIGITINANGRHGVVFGFCLI